jgi:hypothetical protein
MSGVSSGILTSQSSKKVCHCPEKDIELGLFENNTMKKMYGPKISQRI